MLLIVMLIQGVMLLVIRNCLHFILIWPFLVYHMKRSGWEFISRTDVNDLHYKVYFNFVLGFFLFFNFVNK